MKTLIAYATNTGNTYLVAQIIQDLLNRHHQVDLINTSQVDTLNPKDYSLILLGSSSWDWQGKEGHPLQSMKNFLNQLQPQSLSGKSFACFGCGDRDFRIFCGAVDHLEAFVQEVDGRLIHDSLRIDKFYVDILHKIELVKSWAKSLDQSLNS